MLDFAHLYAYIKECGSGCPAMESANTQQTPSTTSPMNSSDTNESWWALIHWNDLDHWMQDNHHIHSYYRRASYSYRRSFASIFHVHNETVNIWSHLLPGILSLPGAALLYHILKSRYDKATSADVVVMSCFFAGAAICLGMSAAFHTLSNHSPNVSRKWHQLDYAGIVCLITGSFIPSVYYAFWCEPQKQFLYWTMVSTGSAL